MTRTIPVALAVVLAACVGPARDFPTYEEKAVETAESARSAVETARLAIRLADGRAFPPTITVIVEEAEEDLDATQGTFDSVQPPDARSDRIRDQLDRILSEATDTVSRMRIAARRAQLQGLHAYAGPLEELSNRLQDFAGDHS